MGVLGLVGGSVLERLKLYRFAPPALLVSVLVVAAACGGQGSEEPADAGDEEEEGGVRAVATFSVLGDMVENVGGEEVELTTLVGPDEDVHTFDPSPSQTADIAEADILFENGLVLEPWIDDLYGSSETEAERVAVGEDDGIELLAAGEGHDHDHGDHDHAHDDHDHEHGNDHAHEDEHDHAHEDENDHAHEDEHDHAHEDEHDHENGNGHDHGDEGHANGHDHDHGEFDPHVWHDAEYAVVMVEAVRDALVDADPENSDAYETRAEEYISEIEDVDSEVRETIESIPEEQRGLVTAHDTFAYFAERYEMEVIGTGLGSVSTEASDPSAGETAALAEEIQQTGVPAIFPENVSNPAVMEQVAAEADVELADPLYTDALGEPGGEAGTYVEMMRHNASTMAGSLSE